jgi:signal transduction histidine kinase/PAS domain-containing protein
MDWNASVLGAPATWPQSLRSVVGLLLGSKFPMFVAWGQELGFLYNDAYAEILAAKHPAAMGARFYDIWSEIWPDISPLIDAALGGEASYSEDLPLRMNRHGYDEDTWFTFSYSPVRDEAGEVAGMFCAVHETTDRVLAERRLAEETERQRRMFSQAPGFICTLTGPDHRFDFVNQAYRSLFGDRDFVGATVREAFPELEGQGFYEALDQVYASGRRFVARDAPANLRDGKGGATSLFLDFIYEPITDPAGKVVGIFCEGHDVTPRHESERRRVAVVTLSDRLRDIDDPAEIAYAAAEVLGQTLGVSRVGYARIDPERETLHIERDWNAPGVVPPTGPVQMRDYGTFMDDLKAGAFISIADVREDPRTASAASALEHRSARSFVNVPVLEQGRLVALFYVNHAEVRPWTPEDLALVRDFAERTRPAVERARNAQVLRQTEAQLRQANETLEQRVTAALEERRQAEDALRQSQKLESMGQLTGGVAHDFNNLLSPIIGGLDLIQRTGLGGEREQRLITAALQSAERAKALVHRLLAFARRQPLQPKAIDMADLVTGMAELIASTVGPQIHVSVQISPDLPPAIADAHQIEMALLNLAVNARDAMPDGGHLRISVTWEAVGSGHRVQLKPAPYICLSVADDGVGMDKGTLARAIEPFFSTKGVGKGTGLGLSMVHGLASQLGGILNIQSLPGLGTNVELWLPISSNPVDAPEARLITAVGAVSGTVLLVDDELLVRLSTADMLSDLGYSVVEANSGEDALRRVDGGLRPDLLVTDHLMAGMSGVDLARELRGRIPELKVLVVSGYAEAEGLAPDLARLTKPFRLTDLTASLARLTEADPTGSA